MYYVCLCVCMRVYACVCVYVSYNLCSVCTDIRKHACMYSLYVSMYTCMYKYACMCSLYVSMYTCMYKYACTCVCHIVIKFNGIFRTFSTAGVGSEATTLTSLACHRTYATYVNGECTTTYTSLTTPPSWGRDQTHDHPFGAAFPPSLQLQNGQLGNVHHYP